MILLPKGISPDNDTLKNLKVLQDEVDSEKTFPKKVEKAKVAFTLKNKIGNKTFDAVKVSLTNMCSGARRCVYCEDSVGDEVEHIYPKTDYPEKCFDWNNYVYACGNCNGPKNNKFAVFRTGNGALERLKNDPKLPPTPPPTGDAVMINPREQDPLDYCILDLRGTFKFVNLGAAGTREHQMADYTYNTVLRLNDQREFLRQARKTAFGNYKARLYQYHDAKQKGADQNKLDRMIDGIKIENHPTVWKEMQRWHKRRLLGTADKELDALFTACPEALTW
jgi:5-methylcytosine-specific restriction endonuclease McrA